MQRLMKQSGLSYSMHSAGTTIGEFFFCLGFGGDRAESRQRRRRRRRRRRRGCEVNDLLIEGPWDEVMHLIGQAHVMVHQKGVVRIQSDIRVGTR